MFSIRVYSNRPGDPDYTMHACARYSVTVSEDRTSARLELDEGKGLPPRPIDLVDGGLAYVMNDRGDTVDTIRSQRVRKVATA